MPIFNPYDLNHIHAMRNDPDFKKKFTFPQKHEGTSFSFFNHIKPTKNMKDDDENNKVSHHMQEIEKIWRNYCAGKGIYARCGRVYGIDWSNGEDHTVEIEGFRDENGRLVIMREKHMDAKTSMKIRQRIESGQVKLQELADERYRQEQKDKEAKEHLLRRYHAYLKQFIPEELHKFIDFSGATWELDEQDIDAHFQGEALELDIPGIERMGIIIKMIPFPKEENRIGIDLACCKTHYIVPNIGFHSNGKPYTYTGIHKPVMNIAANFEYYTDLDIALARTEKVTHVYREKLDAWHKNERAVHKQLHKQIEDLINTHARSREGLPL
jgi:hypothetical protein